MQIIGVILGGGVGSRLKPLTVLRAKPAVPLAGKYRLVDVPISNCINSGITKIYMLTQYNSGSLHHHVQSAYKFDAFTRGFVRLLAAEQTPESGEWFQGTADAVRQSMHHLESVHPDIVVILSGDQLFRLDFKQVISEHQENGADITVATTPVEREDAGDFGILKVDEKKRITHFVEKPGLSGLTPDLLAPGLDDQFLASMGIYVFNYKVLEEVLQENSGTDFGSHILPEALKTHRVFSYVFSGYWKDIGTIGSFWRTNLELTEKNGKFTFYDSSAPIYTRPRFLPPSELYETTLDDCLISEGVKIKNSNIQRSVIGLRAIIHEGTKIKNSVIMGNDYYEQNGEDPETIPLGIGKNCMIENAIIDKNVRIGDNVHISPFGLKEQTTPLFTVKDGVIVIPKGVVLPPNTSLNPNS